MHRVIARLRKLATLPLRLALRVPAVRTRVIHELRHHHYDQLGVNVPLGADLVCPIYDWEAWSSFSHIFLQNEYTKAFDYIDPPERWLDIGCYAGYFSLFTVWMRVRRGLPPHFTALLIDGDSRSEAAVNRLKVLNRIENQLVFTHAAISRQPGDHTFVERPFMNSSIAAGFDIDGVARSVRTVTPEDIFKLLPPPYDLIKIDIEGGEFDFLVAYSSVLEATKYLLMEWHSWHPGGGGLAQLRELLASHQFTLVAEVLRPDEVSHRHGDRVSGVDLYQRNPRTQLPALSTS